MNPHKVNAKYLITKIPIKKQIKGGTDITSEFQKKTQKKKH